MNIELNTNYVPEAIALLLEQYKGKSAIEGLLSAYIEQAQELETVYYDLWSKFLIDTAVGDQLDILGATVGEARASHVDDNDYRAFIRARIAINRSNGLVNEILNILGLAFPDGADFELRQYYPAAFVVFQSLTASVDVDPDVLHSIVDQLAGGGINSQVVYTDYGEYDEFTLSSDPVTVETSSSMGFADIVDGVIIDGGHLTGVM